MLQAIAQGSAPVTYTILKAHVVVEWLEPLMIAGNWMPELVAMAGGDNVFGEAGRDVVILDDLSNSSAAAVDAVRALTSPDLAFIEADAAQIEAARATMHAMRRSRRSHVRR